MIRKAEREDISELTECIRISFKNVAEQFELTQENCPTHPSFCKESWIEKSMKDGIEFYCLESRGKMIGCVALEKATDKVGYLERLAVLPEYRGRGYGAQLVNYVFTKAKGKGLTTVSIAIIAEQLELCHWYEKRGFVKTFWKDFDHLPFRVQFLEVELK